MLNKLLILFLLSITSDVVSQIELEKSLLNKKGIVVLKNSQEDLTIELYEKLMQYDFTDYRNEKSNRLIQLVNGPIINLLSYSNLQTLQINISEQLSEEKRNEEVTELIPIKTLVNIGLGEIYQESIK